MTFLHESVLDLDTKYTRSDIEWNFIEGIPSGLTSVAAVGGTATVVDSTNPAGPALALNIFSSTDAIELRGPLIGRDVVKAVMFNVEGITNSPVSSKPPVWGVGLYPLSGYASYIELAHIASVRSSLSMQNGGGGAKTTVNIMNGTGLTAQNYTVGLLANLIDSSAIAHVGHQYGEVLTNAPVVDLYVKIRATGAVGFETFTVYIRKITFTMWI